MTVLLTLLLTAAAAAPAPASPASAVADAVEMPQVADAPVGDVVEVPQVADASWSVGAAIGPGNLTAAVERRLVGPVWLGLNLAAETSSNDATEAVEQPGESTSTTESVVSAWNAGGGVRFRLQLVPDDAFLRPSLFLGAGIAVAAQNQDATRADPSEPSITLTRESFTTTAEGDFGVALDFALLPWLALRASSSLVHGGYRSTTSSEALAELGAATQKTSTTAGGFFGGVQLQPAVGLQAFF